MQTYNMLCFPLMILKMSDELGKIGIYFDDLYTLRVLEPNVANETSDLKDECSNFTEKLSDFRKITDEFITIALKFSETVDKQKMKGIGAQNLLKAFSKEKEVEQQKIQSQITEKTMELEHLKIEYQYLQRMEQEQQEVIDNYYQNQ